MCAKLEKKNQFSDWNHLYEQCFTDCSLFQECSDDWLNWRAQPGFFVSSVAASLLEISNVVIRQLTSI